MLTLTSKGITREKVDREISQATQIETIAGIVMKTVFSVTKNTFGQAYYDKEFNAFIFDPMSILKYFYGTNIPDRPVGSAECLVVITGAHDIDEENFKAGERTAIVCGMIEEKDKEGNPILDDENNSILKIVDPAFVLGQQTASASPNPPVADQYPPRRTWTKLPFTGELKIVVEEI